MRAAAVVAIFAATAMAQTGGHASPTNGTTPTTTTGKPTTAPTNGAGSLSQNILLGVGAAAVFAANLRVVSFSGPGGNRETEEDGGTKTGRTISSST
ncbi:hypothetical protein V8C42DRAFT_339282 [Trichoderma barbatum]